MIQFHMNEPTTPRQSGARKMSAEARIGTGMTIAGLGFLFLLLALAEHMRAVPKVAFGWLVVGIIMTVLGCIIAAAGRGK